MDHLRAKVGLFVLTVAVVPLTAGATTMVGY